MTSCLNREMRNDEIDQTMDVGPQLKPRRCQNEQNFDGKTQGMWRRKEQTKLRKNEGKEETGWSGEWLAESRCGPVVTSS